MEVRTEVELGDIAEHMRTASKLPDCSFILLRQNIDGIYQV